jgi:glucokinase
MINEMLIIGDVGGTNCRLAVCDPSTGLIDEIRIMPVEDFRSLDEAINAYRDALPSYKFLSASISIANPITGDRIAMTNAHWDFSIEQTRKSSHLEWLIMLNDWESVALSLAILQDSDLERINDRPANGSGTRALCGVGTGLGVAGLVAAKDGAWVPVAGEGGHVSFSPVDEEESQILNILMGSHDHVSFEKILSGPGLVGLHQAIAAIDGASVETLMPQQIVARAASQDDPVCKKTLEVFCGILGNFAGNLCLTLGATGGIYVGGGVIQKIDETGAFERERFLDRLALKGRLSGWLRDIPAYLLKSPYAGLIGSAAALGLSNARVSSRY